MKQMTGTSILNPHPPDFERFLYATVGEDRNGYAVTVLSTLARLGLDPWDETAELVALGREAAGTRLGLLLSKFRDVPTLGSAHRRIAQELTLLLPESKSARSLQRAASTAADSRQGPSGTIWAILAVVFVLVQILFTAAPGSGE